MKKDMKQNNNKLRDAIRRIIRERVEFNVLFIVKCQTEKIY